MTKHNTKGLEVWIRNDEPHGDLEIVHDVIETDCYELRAMKKRGFDPKVIVDIGAQVGCFSVLAHQLWPDALIVAVEPNRESFELLEMNVAGIKGRAYNCAISHRKGAIYVEGQGSTGGGFVTTKEEFEQRGDMENPSTGWRFHEVEYKIYTLTFPELLKSIGIDAIDLLKLDCEGGEYDVMADLPLEGVTIRHVVGEYHGKGAAGFKAEADRAFPNLKIQVTDRGQHLGPFTSFNMKPSIVFLTADDGQVEEYAVLSRANKEQYCEQYGYTFYHFNPNEPEWEPELSPAWNLVAGIRAAFKCFNPDEDGWVFLTGADSVIVNEGLDLWDLISPFAEQDADLLFTRDANGLNTGGILVRNNPHGRLFIDEVWDYRGQTLEVAGPDGTKHQWEEQGAFIKVLQEQPNIVKALELPQEITNGYEPEIYGSQYMWPIFVAHYPGKPTPHRVFYMRRAMGLVERTPLGLGQWIDNEGNVKESSQAE
jgi:FkbM family methyltransferase